MPRCQTGLSLTPESCPPRPPCKGPGTAPLQRATGFLVLCVLILPGCNDASSTPRAEHPTESAYRLDPVVRFGWNEIGDSIRPLTDKERLYSGAVLGDPGDVAVGEDGTVYVLDRAFKKIVVFSPAGEFQRLILGGAGKGPGEFGLPVSLTFGPGGDLWVWDMFLQRLSRFSPDGRLKLTAQVTVLPRMMSLVGSKTALYGARHGRDSIPMVVELDTLGRVVREFAFPTSGDLRITGGDGLIPGLGIDPQGRLLIARPEVGTWSTVTAGVESIVSGRPLFPDQAASEHVDPEYGIRTQRIPAQPVNMGALPDGPHLLRFLDNTVGDRGAFRLAIMDSLGGVTAVLDSVGVGAALKLVPAERALYAAENAPFPRIVKFLLTKGTAAP